MFLPQNYAFIMYGKHIDYLSLSLSLSLTDAQLTYALMLLALLWRFYQ